LRILDPKDFYGATQGEVQKMAELSASLLFNIGSCFYNLNNWKNAEIYYSETIMINPNHIKALYKRALCRYEL
jgi:tetratricopeptide (TPR) repeat protein